MRTTQLIAEPYRLYCRKIFTYLLRPYDFCLIDFLEQFKFRFESSFIVSKTKQQPEEFLEVIT